MQDINYDIKRLHRVLLELVVEFDRICRKYNIKYSVGYGTMLGAIRHKGFIPWDDDVDIMMPREEYEKFCDVVAREIGKDFFFQTVDTDSFYPYHTARLRKNHTSMIYEKWMNSSMHQGIYIDILPYDAVPDSKIKYFFQKVQIIVLTPFRFLKNKEVFFAGGKNIPDFVKRVFFILFSRLPINAIHKKELQIEKKYNSIQTKNVAFLSEGNLLLKNWYPIRPLPREIFDKYIDVEFEDIKVKCSAKYEKLLVQWYGDYMQLPSEEKRVIYHQPAFFSEKVDYKEYIRKRTSK